MAALDLYFNERTALWNWKSLKLEWFVAALRKDETLGGFLIFDLAR